MTGPMKMIITLSLVFLASIFWLIGGSVARLEIEKLVVTGEIDYGPLPIRVAKNYDFNGLPKAFNQEVDLAFLSSLSKWELKNFLLSSTHKLYRDGLNEYLDKILSLSEEYKVDPLWVISVITVESGFNPEATSHKNARGLMQVRPDTAKHLVEILNIKVSDENLYEPNHNLELGIFYLKKLLQNFRYRYDLATIAYNVGPNSLRNSLKEDSIVTEEHNYLRKVNGVYLSYLRPYLKLVKGKPLDSSRSQKYALSGAKTSEIKVANLTKSYIQRFYYSERL